LAKLDGELADNLKSKKPRKGSPYHYARLKGGGVAVRANPYPHKPSQVERSWQLDFACIARHSKMPAPTEYDDSVNDTDNTGWYYRDEFHSAASGNLIRDCGEPKMTTPTARVNRSSYRALTSGVGLYLIPDTKVWDNNVFWNQLANQSRLTIRSCGLYLVHATALYTGVSGGRRELFLDVNRTAEIVGDRQIAPNTNLIEQSVDTIWYFNPDDYVEVRSVVNANGVTVQLRSFWILAITPEAII